MIAAILASGLLSQPSPPPKLVENWHMDLRKGLFPELRNNQLWIAGKCIDVITGFAKSPRKEGVKVNVKFASGYTQVQPEFKIGKLDAKMLFSSSDFDLAIAGPPYESKNAFHPTTFAMLDNSGNLIGSVDGSNLNRPILHVPPYHVTGNLNDGYLRVTSYPMQSEHDVSYECLILLKPFKPSPLPIYLFLDLTQPKRAIGYWHPNFNKWLAETNWYTVEGKQLVCGDIFTGEIHWKLPPNFRWAGRVSNRLLCLGPDGKWNILNENSGDLMPFDSDHLEGLIPSHGDTFSIEGELITMRLHGNERRMTVSSYSIQ